MSLAFRIDPSRMRLINKGGLKAFFAVDFGQQEDGDFTPLFTVNDFALIALSNGSGYFAKGPEQVRRDKEGKPIEENGFWKRDPIYMPYGEKHDGKFQRTKAAFRFADALSEEATKVYEAKAGPRQETVAAAVSEKDPGSPLDGLDDDDDLPF